MLRRLLRLLRIRARFRVIDRLVNLEVNLDVGTASATVMTNDLSHDYVHEEFGLFNMIVIKFGGHAMTDEHGGFAQAIADAIAAGVTPVVVHGGGPQIGEASSKLPG
jgi:hypothetical protein